jgi:hypothetical protein
MLTSAEETRLTCFILFQNIFLCSKQPSLVADVNTIMNLPWYPRKIVHFSLVFSPSRPKISMITIRYALVFLASKEHVFILNVVDQKGISLSQGPVTRIN